MNTTFTSVFVNNPSREKGCIVTFGIKNLLLVMHIGMAVSLQLVVVIFAQEAGYRRLLGSFGSLIIKPYTYPYIRLFNTSFMSLKVQ